MKFYRRYVQFNDLVIDGYDMLRDSDPTSVSFDIVKHEYTFKNGDYAPLRSRTPRIESTEVSFTLLLSMKKIACELREFYRRFIVEQITKAGKLWAVQNNELIWAYAIPQSYSEPTQNVRKNELEIDVELYLPQGVWHKADKQKTFIKENDICQFLSCLDYHKLNPCCDCGTCNGEQKFKCCCCDELEKEDALCYNENLLQEMYNDCQSSYRIYYNCDRAKVLFTDDVNPFLGQRICRDVPEEGVIAGQIYYDGDIPSSEYTIYLNGGGTNIWISVNGNANYINGTYEGKLIVTSNGTVYNECGEMLGADVYQIPEDHVFGFTFYPGWNSVIIRPNDCCEMQCAYFQIDRLTI